MPANRARFVILALAAIAIGGALVNAASANNLVYRPLHPSFAGNPIFDAWLFGLANGQNMFKAGSGGTGGTGTGTGSGIGGNIGGPVIVINPGSTTVGAPSTEAQVDQVQ